MLVRLKQLEAAVIQFAEQEGKTKEWKIQWTLVNKLIDGLQPLKEVTVKV